MDSECDVKIETKGLKVCGQKEKTTHTQRKKAYKMEENPSKMNIIKTCAWPMAFTLGPSIALCAKLNFTSFSVL